MSFSNALLALLASIEFALVAVAVALVLVVLVVVVAVRRSRSGTSAGTVPVDRTPSERRRVTKARRSLGMLVDGLGIVLVTMGIAAAVYLCQFLALGATPDDRGALASTVGVIATFVVWTVVTLRSGRTVGDLVVGIRYVGGARPEWFARILRFLGGIGGYMILANLPVVGAGASSTFLVVSVVATLATDGGRGLPGLLSGRRVADAREVGVDVRAS